MADKIAKRGVSIFIDGKEVKNSVAGITSEMRKLEAQQKKMTIGSDEYVAAAKKIAYLKSLHKEHIQHQKEIAKQYDNMSEAADKSSKKTEGGFSRMANGFNKYFAIFTAGLAAVTGLTLGLKKFMDMRNEVEDSKANLKSLTGLGDQDIEWLRNYAKELSTTTTETGIRITASAKEIMDGFTTIGSKRPELLKNKEAMAAVTKEALTLAAAGKMDVATAFDVVTASMNQFNLGADQSKRIINAIAAGSLEGSAEADSLAGSLKNVGTVASSSNMSLEDTVAMLEVLASKQLMGEEAGTKLRGAILKLKDAGIGYTSGAFNMRDALVELNAQMDKKNSATQKDALMQKIFGAENITAGQILIDNVAAYDKLRVAVTGTNTAYDQAIIQTGTVSARMAQAQNRFNELGMELVKNLNPAMLKATDFGNMFLKMLVKLPTFLKENKIGIIAFVVALTAYLTAVNYANIVTKTKLLLAGLERAADYAKIAALRIKILLTGQATIAELRLVAAQRALNASMMLNIYAAAAVAIAAIGVAVYKLATLTTDGQKAMKDFNREAHAQSTELNNIFEAYKKANPQSSEKIRLLNIIKEKYGSYIKNLINEKGEIIDIEKAQKQANTALRQSIALKIKNQYIESYTSKEIQNQADVMTSLRDKIAKSKGETVADVVIGQIGETMQKNIENPMLGGLPKVKEILKQYGLLSNPMTSGDFNKMTNSLASSYFRIGQKTKEFDAVFKSLVGDVASVADAADGGTGGDITPSGGGTGSNGSGNDKGYKEAEKLLEISLKKRTATIKQFYADGVIGEELYNKLISADTLMGLEEKLALQKKYGEETIDTEIAITDAKIAQKQRELKLTESIENEIKKLTEKIAEVNEETIINEQEYGLATRLAILEAFHKKGLLSEEDYLKKLADLYKGNQKEINKYIKDTDLKNNQENYDKGLIGRKSYLDNVRGITRSYYEEIFADANQTAADISAVADAAANLVSTIVEAETKAVDKKYAVQLQAAKKAGQDTTAIEEQIEAEKLAIKKKYADLEFAISVAKIGAETAVAIMKAIAELGPVAGPIAAGLIGVTGLAQIAVANTQRESVKNLWTGGFTGSGGKYEPKGIVHGNEFVANSEALQNPNLMPMFSAIDAAQRMGTVRSMKPRDLTRALHQESYDQGGAVRQMPAGNQAKQSEVYVAGSIAKMEKTIDRLSSILDQGIEARSVISGNTGSFEQTKKYEKLIKNAKR